MNKWLNVIAEIIVIIAEATEGMEAESEKIKQIEEVEK